MCFCLKIGWCRAVSFSWKQRRRRRSNRAAAAGKNPGVWWENWRCGSRGESGGGRVPSSSATLQPDPSHQGGEAGDEIQQVSLDIKLTSFFNVAFLLNHKLKNSPHIQRVNSFGGVERCNSLWVAKTWKVQFLWQHKWESGVQLDCQSLCRKL